MHLADGFADPKVWVTMDVVAAAAVGYASRRAQRELAPQRVTLMGIAAAFVFAAQMLNFRIGPSSGHLVGGALVAILFGPWIGMLVMTAVIALQALFFADGGLAALGINVFNMGLVGTLLGYFAYRGLRQLLRFRGGEYLSAGLAAYLSLVAGAVLLSFQLALFQPQFPLGPFLGTMLAVHLVVGIGEALATAAALAVVMRSAPQAVATDGQVAGAFASSWAVAAMVLIVAMATVGAQFASPLEDGLEYSISHAQLAPQHPAAALPAWWPRVFADYTVAGRADSRLGLAAAGLVGVLAVLVLTAGVGHALAPARRRRARPGPGAGGLADPAKDGR